MKPAQHNQRADGLQDRLALLGEILESDSSRLPTDIAERATTVHTNATARLGHGTSHTVVALAGATGSGKSSLFNALAGAELAPASPRRPTTASTRSATFGATADGLLDWLSIAHRHVLHDDALQGLVLLDLPDHDSTAAAHRAEVDRLVEVVDVFCWVLDPQKYADAALHDNYLQRFAGHGAVSVVALNQIDRLSADERRACLSDLQRLLAEDGLGAIRIIATSAVTGEGVVDLRRELGARVAERRAVVARIEADVDWVGGEIFSSCGDTTRADVPERERAALVAATGRVAGVDTVADAVGAAFRHRGVQSFGWPPLRWTQKLRPDPLRRLGLGSRTASSKSADTSASVSIRRTSLPPADATTRGAVASAGRDLVEVATQGMPPHWHDRVETIVQAGVADLPDAADAALGTAELPVQAPAWWSAARWAQWLATASLVVGLVWLSVLFGVAWLQLPDPPTVRLGRVPLPTLLTLGGLAVGLLIAAIGRRLVGIGARRRSAAARESLNERVAVVVDERVVRPTTVELVVLRGLSARARALAGTRR